MNLTPEQRAIGRDNYYDAVGVTRRDFLLSAVAGGAVSTMGLGAMYFGYDKVNDPVRVGIIGTGDQGGVLIGAINPDYLQVVAINDVRPSSIHRGFHGDYGGGDPQRTFSIRSGLMHKYGWKSESEARKHVKVYDGSNGGWQELIKDKDVEAIIIALPLHLHHPVAVAAMREGKHVLTEKLMAHNISECKEMARVSEETGMLLSTGHQRHYSILYDNAVHLLRQGLLGELHFIRAQWHRGNLPGRDSWEMPMPGGEETATGEHFDRIGIELERFWDRKKQLDDAVARDRGIDHEEYEMLLKRIAQWEAWDADQHVDAANHGYQDMTLEDGRFRSALEELVRWRLWDRTGGGLMAELGSHQLDAASIFISALRADGKLANPLTVHAVGGRYVFPYNRDADDHVFCTYEFPGPGYDVDGEPEEAVGYYDRVANYPDPERGIPPYEEDPNKRVIVTYSSTMGNGFGGYGETVMGSKGTMILDREQEVMLFGGASTSTRVRVRNEGGRAVLDTQATDEGGDPVARAAEGAAPVSRGYTEEMEHFAWCIRNNPRENKTRCHPEIAVADAIISLTGRLAIHRAKAGRGGFVKFKKEWFDIDHPDTPEEDLKIT